MNTILKWKWIITFVVSNASLLPIILLLFLFFLILVPFMLFALPDTFQNDSSGKLPWWEAPTHIDVDGTAYAWPVPQVRNMTSSFGEQRGAEIHKGIDIAHQQGAAFTELQPIYAMAAGKVTAAGPASGYGQWIVIDHGQGLTSIYGHLESVMDVRAGDQVTKGQRIARIGRGKVGTSTGPHLHLQVEQNGVPVSPLSYVQPPTNAMPAGLNYVAMNVPAMKDWLDKRKSALAEASVLASIDRAAQSQNVDPYLLIAITGQEQSFVPRTGAFADKIIRNPWNVFGCWCQGKGAELTTEEAAKIAAKTIVKLSQNRPASTDPISWLNDPANPNGIYAEHRGWWLGVSRFYKAIHDEVNKGS
ncbi:M23 family metallopeptidase [Paenibacillus tyrfis]|uniref:M23 family metallopeptidase n=1 Tax=Paenibacillus tyrfis TaxID=1501230 RepID=UPI000B58DA2F|nr:M23 family metallopeptidase [Paenibacillus tyrfis]